MKRVIFEGQREQHYPALGVTLVPGQNDLEDDVAARFIACGTVRPDEAFRPPKKPHAEGPKE